MAKRYFKTKLGVGVIDNGVEPIALQEIPEDASDKARDRIEAQNAELTKLNKKRAEIALPAGVQEATEADFDSAQAAVATELAERAAFIPVYTAEQAKKRQAGRVALADKLGITIDDLSAAL